MNESYNNIRTNKGEKMFKIGEKYDRQKIHDEFGGQRQSGISNCANFPYVFLFSNPNGKIYGYEDKWIDNDTYQHAGHGQAGNMVFARGNKALRHHIEDNKQVHIFAKQSIFGDYIYRGQFKYESHSIVEGSDINNEPRKVILFILKRVI